MQVNTGRNGSKQFTMRSAFRECNHTQPDFEPGPYGIKTVSTRFHPYLDPHRNPCQFLMDFERYGGEKSFGHVQIFYTDLDSVLISVLTRF
jgi:hypothetical protein